MTEAGVGELTRAAARGDQDAWNQLVGRYTPLVVSVIRSYRLGDEDAADVNQTLWLRLVEHLDRIRDPQALPMWIITTTRNECMKVLRSRQRTRTVDPLVGLDVPDTEGPELDEALLAAERQQVLRDAFALLGPACRTLLTLLMSEPPLSYDEISERLGMARGSIGPTRSRCLDKLRRSRPVVTFLQAVQDTEARGGGLHDVATVG
jgi:RNA polymerase sigma factor (sigma-70 family)